MLEALIVALALVGVYLLRRRGLTADSSSSEINEWDPYLAAVPVLLGFATGQGAGKAGWFSYPPLSDDTAAGTPGPGMDMWVVGVMLAVAGSGLLGGAVLWTILRRRAAGMTMLRLPAFTWTMLATCLLEMLKKNYHVAWFLWTEENAARLYSQLGFRPVRRFAVLRKELGKRQ